jgi:hypothetical protein
VMAYDPDYIVVSDSSAILALLYMTDDFIKHQAALTFTTTNAVALAKRAASRYDIIFRCLPVHASFLYDPNRIHSFEQSEALDKGIDKVLDLAEVDRSKVVTLSGNTHERVRTASCRVMEAWTQRLLKKV